MANQPVAYANVPLLRKNGKGKIIGGCILLGFAVIYLIMFFSGELDMSDSENPVTTLVVLFLVFFGVGGLLLFFGVREKNRAARYRKYLSVVSSGVFSVHDIAVKMSVAEQQAYADLQKMLDCNIFPRCYLDMQNGRLALPGSNQTTTMVCAACGASNTVTPHNKICAYCGSSLS